MNINLNSGEYIIIAYNLATGEMISNNITVLSSITGSDLTKYYRNDSQYYVKAVGFDGNPLVNSTVTFNINGVFYNRTTDENGIAKLNINLNPGNYTITALNTVTGEMCSNNIQVLPVLFADDLEMNYKDGSTFNATVLDGQGNPKAGENVTFNVNGVFYTKTTDSNGVAKLNINLLPAEYIITSSYEGSNVANTIVIH